MGRNILDNCQPGPVFCGIKKKSDKHKKTARRETRKKQRKREFDSASGTNLVFSLSFRPIARTGRHFSLWLDSGLSDGATAMVADRKSGAAIQDRRSSRSMGSRRSRPLF